MSFTDKISQCNSGSNELPDDTPENRNIVLGLLRKIIYNGKMSSVNGIISNAKSYEKMIRDLRSLVSDVAD